MTAHSNAASDRRPARALLSALVVLLAVASPLTPAPAPARARPAAQASPTPHSLPDPDAPCGLEAERSVWPTVVEVGQPLTVTVTMSHDCRQVPIPATDVLLVLEDTVGLVQSDLPPVERQRQLVGFRGALHDLVDRVSANPASRIGFIDAAAPGLRTDLDSASFAEVRGAIDGLDASGACHQRAAALAAAVRTLDSAQPFAAPPTVVYLAGSAPPCTGGGVPPPAPPSFDDACDELKGRSILSWIDHSGRHDPNCGLPAWNYRSNADGAALPGIVADIVYRLFDAQLPSRMDYADNYDTLWFSYIFGSGRPAPDSVGQWTFRVDGIAAARNTLQFQLSPLRPGIVPVALPNGPTLILSTRTTSTAYHLANPRVCIHRAGRRAEDCPNWPDPGPQPTSIPAPTTAPTTATPTPPVGPTASASKTPTALSTGQASIYLPQAIRP